MRKNNYMMIEREVEKADKLWDTLNSILYDSFYVDEVKKALPGFCLLANMRLGIWTHPQYDETVYFKSTDGHYGKWNFSFSRLNLHLLSYAFNKDGCIIVDSTRKGKQFPDSLSKTIPIWICVMN
ncbi:MAG: putative initiator tRNA phosphoribosyl transferase family protein [Streblomastix strix]|uniref:Putative initiator tRNA phosphoribosyl transferase family protein n=1 Tax=Streblomastix strix TaxID=222440 RepID=A0A5J4UUM3_9EUKA|nr:MAG: putative initiator tRNA phosphoribosyl transferase family protein [Streblomastix strix]